MICAVLARMSIESFRAGMLEAREGGADLCEIRLDSMPSCRPEEVGRLLEGRPLPVIVTCRPHSDRGGYRGDESNRLALLQHAVNAGAEFVDLEWDRWGGIDPGPSTRLVASQHDFEKTPDDLDRIVARLESLEGASIVKIATHCRDLRDVLRIKKALENASLPMVGIGMGSRGLASRTLGTAWGGEWTYVATSRTDITAPGLPTLGSPFRPAGPETSLYGLLGNPALHSFGPAVHGAAFGACQLDAVYVALEASDLQEGLDFAHAAGFAGLSVTMPFKEIALATAHSADETTREVGAANTLLPSETGWRATNTDVTAVREILSDSLGPNPRGDVLILGAGGAARSAAHAAHSLGLGVRITARRALPAEDLARSVRGRQVPWSERAGAGVQDVRALINATPVGMDPHPDQTPIELDQVADETLVFEMIYQPERTRLLEEALALELPTVDGKTFFLQQAFHQFTLFTGREAPRNPMEQAFTRESSRKGSR